MSDENGHEFEVAESEEEREALEELDPEVMARREAALRLVRKFGDPVLKSKAAPVTVFDDALAAEVDEMGRIMSDALGIGLAANQIGRLRSVLVYRVEEDSPVQALINPVREWSSKDEEWFQEGCLSLPRILVDVERPLHVRVRAQDITGAQIVVEASGLEARVIQHEMDHLDGTLILDRTPRDQRKDAMRTLRELDDEAAA